MAADSAFPAGAFAHSGGLEAVQHWKVVESAEDLWEYLRHSLVQIGRSAVPFVSESYHDVYRLQVLDAEYDVFLSNHVTNRASRAQGRALLTAAEIAFQPRRRRAMSTRIDADGEICHPWQLTELRKSMSEGRIAAHLPVVFGAVCRLLNVPLAVAHRMFIYTSARDLLSAAVRLNIVGVFRAQAFQFELIEFIEKLAEDCETLRAGDATQTATVLDLLQGTHDRLYTRLFQS